MKGRDTGRGGMQEGEGCRKGRDVRRGGMQGGEGGSAQ